MRNITPHILLGSGKLAPFAEKIKAEFDSAVEKISAKVPASDIDVVIKDNPRGAITEIGIGGYTFDPHYISVSLDPEFSNFDSVIGNELYRTLAHEIHHALRMKEIGYGKTLLDALITEGLADHFDIEVNNGNPEPWTVALDEEQLKELLEKAKEEFNNKKYDHDAWFFGSKERNIPKWTGYSLGFKIVGDYLKKNPDKRPSALYSAKARKFI